nr:9086_t:CDS:10 [Entrophospora candida]
MIPFQCLTVEGKSIWEKAIDCEKRKSIIYSWESIGKIKEFQTPSSKYLTESDIYTFETIIFKHFHDQFSNYGLGNTKSYNNLIKVRLKKFVNKIPDIRSEGYSAKSMKMILLRFSNIGTHIKRLENVAEKCINNPHFYGLTGVAFGRSLDCFTSFIRTSILVRIEKSIINDDQIKIIQLYHLMDETSIILEIIARFCKCDVSEQHLLLLPEIQQEQWMDQGFYLPFGNDILSEIYNFIELIDISGSLFLKSVFLAFLEQSSCPFFEMLSSWLGINTSSNDNINNDNDNNNYSLLSEILGDQYCDPYDILEAGKSLRLLRDCYPNHALCYLGMKSHDQKSNTTSSTLWSVNLKWIFTQGEIDDMHDHLRNYLKDKTFEILAQQKQRKIDHLPINKTNSLFQKQQLNQQQHHNHHQCHFNSNSNPINHSKVEKKGSNNYTSKTLVFDIISNKENPTITLIEHFIETQSSQKSYKQYVPPLGVIKDLVIRHTLLSYCQLLNSSILSVFFQEYNLCAHFKVLKDFMLMGNGKFVQGLNDALFSDNVDYGEKFYDTNYSSLLQSPINAWAKVNNLDDLLMFSIKKSDDYESCNDPHVEALDFLQLEYKPPYPVNIIISSNVLDNYYKKIFTLLLRILRMGSVVRHIFKLSHNRYLYYDDANNDYNDSKLIHIFCFRSQQFIAALNDYVFDIVISSTWSTLMKRLNKIAKASKFESPQSPQSHKEFCENVNMDIDANNEELTSKINPDSDIYVNNNDDDDDDDNGVSSISNSEYAIKDLESLRSYHEHILDCILFQCFLKEDQEHIIKDLNEILSVILSFARTLRHRRFRNYSEQQKQEYWSTINSLYEKFILYTSNFVNTLKSLDEKGTRYSDFYFQLLVSKIARN